MSKRQCKNDGLIAFGLPWLAITAFGTVTTYNLPDSAFLCEAVVPGILAGATGLLLYKLTKKTIHTLRRQSPRRRALPAAN